MKPHRAVDQSIGCPKQSIPQAAGAMKAWIDGADNVKKGTAVGRVDKMNQGRNCNSSSPKQSKRKCHGLRR